MSSVFLREGKQPVQPRNSILSLGLPRPKFNSLKPLPEDKFGLITLSGAVRNKGNYSASTKNHNIPGTPRYSFPPSWGKERLGVDSNSKNIPGILARPEGGNAKPSQDYSGFNSYSRAENWVRRSVYISISYKSRLGPRAQPKGGFAKLVKAHSSSGSHARAVGRKTNSSPGPCSRTERSGTKGTKDTRELSEVYGNFIQGHLKLNKRSLFESFINKNSKLGNYFFRLSLKSNSIPYILKNRGFHSEKSKPSAKAGRKASGPTGVAGLPETNLKKESVLVCLRN